MVQSMVRTKVRSVIHRMAGIMVRRVAVANLMIYKPAIKYMFKEGEMRR